MSHQLIVSSTVLRLKLGTFLSQLWFSNSDSGESGKTSPDFSLIGAFYLFQRLGEAWPVTVVENKNLPSFENQCENSDFSW